MANLNLGSLVENPHECVAFIHSQYPGKQVLSSIHDPKVFWNVAHKFVEGVDGALLFSASTKITAQGTFLVPAAIAAAAFFKGVTSLQLCAELNSTVTVKHTGNGVRYYCGGTALLLGFETNCELEIAPATPVVVEAFIRHLFVSQRSHISAVA